MARHSQLTVVAMGTSSALILPSRETRVGLLFTPHLTATFTVRPDETVAANLGLNLLPGAGAVELTLDTHGDIVKHGWYGIASGASTFIGVLETFEI